MGLVASVCQPSTLRMLIWPEASRAQHGCGVGRWQDGLGRDPSLELLVQPLDGVGGANAAPLARRQWGEAEEPLAGFL
jgi:hypothetical protein